MYTIVPVSSFIHLHSLCRSWIETINKAKDGSEGQKYPEPTYPSQNGPSNVDLPTTVQAPPPYTPYAGPMPNGQPIPQPSCPPMSQPSCPPMPQPSGPPMPQPSCPPMPQPYGSPMPQPSGPPMPQPLWFTNAPAIWSTDAPAIWSTITKGSSIICPIIWCSFIAETCYIFSTTTLLDQATSSVLRQSSRTVGLVTTVHQLPPTSPEHTYLLHAHNHAQ